MCHSAHWVHRGARAIPELVLAIALAMQLVRATTVSGSQQCVRVPVVQDEVLLAYQIAFDLVENELQSFILKVSWSCAGHGSCWCCGLPNGCHTSWDGRAGHAQSSLFCWL